MARRLDGEPLAWLTGQAAFGDLTRAGPPRRLRATLAEHRVGAARRGTAPRARVRRRPVHRHRAPSPRRSRAARPQARVVATDNDPRAVACARANGVEALRRATCSPRWRARCTGHVDVVVAVVPYVPSPALALPPERHPPPRRPGALRRRTRRHRRSSAGSSPEPPASSGPAVRSSSSSEASRPTCSIRCSQATASSMSDTWSGRGRRPPGRRGHVGGRARQDLLPGSGQRAGPAAAQRRANTSATVVRSTTCQRVSRNRYSHNGVSGAHTT